MRAIQAIAAILIAVATAAAVWGIKRGADWWLASLTPAQLHIATALIIGPLLLGAAWLWVLKPLVDRRKQREQPGRGKGVERQAARD